MAKKKPAKKKPSEKKKDELTCFVVIGFGKKTDHYTGRTLNLDATYQKLIKPAFDRVGVRCFRAIDVNRTGSIDKLMYYWIYHADFVVADLSTMNANVFYELGVRHAQRKSSTLLMVEDGIFEENRLPFDLSHTIIRGYKHLGDDIAPDTAKQFVDDFAALLQDLITRPVRDAVESDTDSPVYTYLQGMRPPKYVDLRKELERQQAEDARRAHADPEDVKKQSLAEIIDRAETARRNEQFPRAVELFRLAIEDDEKDLYLRQRLALATYKQVEEHRKEDKTQNQQAIEVLKAAERILIDHCKLLTSTDPETLGLAGAVNKRLYERTGTSAYFDKSVFYYEKGFYISQDYYNGINVAYMYTVRAAETAEKGERFDAIVNYGHANLIRRKVAQICEDLTKDATGFAGRRDQKWVYQTLAQAYLGMEQEEKAEAQMQNIEAYSEGKFDMTTFKDQNRKLIDAMARFARCAPTNGQPAAEDAAAPETTEAAATELSPEPGTAVVPAAAAEVSRRPDGPISIDLGRHQDKPVKSIEVTCKVDFD